MPAYRNEKTITKLTRTQAKTKPAGNTNIISRLGKDKGWLATISRALIIALSLASAHYFGFISSMPFEIASVVTIDFLASFISTFSFYFLLCYTISRVIAFIASQMLSATGHATAALLLRLRRHWPKHFHRTASIAYKEATKYEAPAYYVVLLLSFGFLFNISYLELIYTNIGETTRSYIILTLIAIALKLGFLARSPAKVIRRLRDENRVAYRRQAVKSAIYFSSAIALAFSYYAGLLRFDKLKNENPVTINSEHYTGTANILLKSGNAQLALQHDGKQREFVFFNQHISLRLETNPAVTTTKQAEE